MRKLLLFIVAVGLLPSLALAQTRSTIPSFPDDEAQLVDPGSLDVPTATTSTTTKPASATPATTTTTPATTTTVTDTPTGTPTIAVILISGIGALGALIIARKIHLRKNHDRFW